MVASNYGRIPLLKYFIDKNADIQARDSTKFTPLLYSVKQNEIAIFAYLLFKGGDINDQDGMGCGVVHWAAYKNNLWLLKFFKKIGMNLEEKDNSGFSPLKRAIDNFSFECAEYLIKNVSHEVKSFENFVKLKFIFTFFLVGY
jgi:palmitoyltransferase ZDHHC13/17